MKETLKKRIEKLEGTPSASGPQEIPPSLQAKMDEAREKGDFRECARLLVTWMEANTSEEISPQARRSLEILYGNGAIHE